MASKMNPVIWFEIPVKDIARAKKFYESALGIELSPPTEMFGAKFSMFPMQMNTAGAGGSLMQTDKVQPSQQGTTVYFNVDSIDPVLERIDKLGGKTCLPRTSIGQYGFMAHFQDTEGNRVALHEVPSEPCGKA